MSVDNPDERCVVEICLHIVYIVFPDLQKHGDPVVERYRQDMGRQPAFDTLGQAVVHYEKILELYQQGVSTFMGCLLLLDYFLLHCDDFGWVCYSLLVGRASNGGTHCPTANRVGEPTSYQPPSECSIFCTASVRDCQHMGGYDPCSISAHVFPRLLFSWFIDGLSGCFFFVCINTHTHTHTLPPPTPPPHTGGAVQPHRSGGDEEGGA